MSLPELVNLLLDLLLHFHYIVLHLIDLILQDLQWITLVERLVLADSLDELAKHEVLRIDELCALDFCSFLLLIRPVRSLEPMCCL